MPRPKKQTVDYFPHVVRHGKTMLIVEQKHGNDGYAFWFKLLEMLGDSEGHFLDLSKPNQWEFLQSITRISPEKCEEILDLLARLEAIDVNLWKNRIVWSDNFITGIAPVYRKRGEETPPKPVFLEQKLEQPAISCVDNDIVEKSREERGEKRRERREEKRKDLSASPGGDAPASLTVQQFAILYNETRPPELSAVNLPFKRTAKDMEKIKDALKRNPDKGFWLSVMEKVRNTPFLRGHSERGWKPTLDFIATHAEVILDGKYDGVPGKKPQAGGLSWLEKRRKMREEPPEPPIDVVSNASPPPMEEDPFGPPR